MLIIVNMKRVYELVMEEHLEKERQMLFLVGPRQVGKTTASLEVVSPRSKHFYFNCDITADRTLINQGADKVAEALELDKFREGIGIVIFDELHKYRKWKTFLKGFFDKYSKQIQIIVTGSARLDIYKRGGDSMMGRYFLYRLHPLTVAEIINPELRETEIAPVSQAVSDEEFNALFTFGGFPEPFLRRNRRFYSRWKNLRTQQLFQDDIRDLTKIHDLGQIQVLAELLRDQAGCLTSYASLASKVQVSIDTIARWIEILKSFYYCFTLKPWTKNITRSLLKEPKVFLWDWSFVEDEGAKIENFIASHLLKAVNFWTDQGFGEYDLHFLRDKEKREVDFLVSRDKKPWFIVEVKKSAKEGLSKSLYHYQQLTKAPHAFQVAFDMPYVAGNCFSSSGPIIVPAKTFLSQLI
jgi:uncharacterized protein